MLMNQHIPLPEFTQMMKVLDYLASLESKQLEARKYEILF